MNDIDIALLRNGELLYNFSLGNLEDAELMAVGEIAAAMVRTAQTILQERKQSRCEHRWIREYPVGGFYSWKCVLCGKLTNAEDPHL